MFRINHLIDYTRAVATDLNQRGEMQRCTEGQDTLTITFGGPSGS